MRHLSVFFQALIICLIVTAPAWADERDLLFADKPRDPEPASLFENTRFNLPFQNACGPRVNIFYGDATRDAWAKERLLNLRMSVTPKLQEKLEDFKERVKDPDLKWGAPIYIRVFKYGQLNQTDPAFFEPSKVATPHDVLSQNLINKSHQDYQWKFNAQRPNGVDQGNGVAEVWMRTSSGRYELFESYPVCFFSGLPGPKRTRGDLQSPEGLFKISPGQMHPGGKYHLSMDLAFENNPLTRQWQGSGSALLMHGKCVSIGCLAMTDERMNEIYALTEAALNAHEDYSVPLHVFPYRMTAENLNRFSPAELEDLSEWVRDRKDHCSISEFWSNLSGAYEWFEKNRTPAEGQLVGRGCAAKYTYKDSTTPRRRNCAKVGVQ